jgi:hypothetical protein
MCMVSLSTSYNWRVCFSLIVYKHIMLTLPLKLTLKKMFVLLDVLMVKFFIRTSNTLNRLLHYPIAAPYNIMHGGSYSILMGVAYIMTYYTFMSIRQIKRVANPPPPCV